MPLITALFKIKRLKISYYWSTENVFKIFWVLIKSIKNTQDIRKTKNKTKSK